MGGDECLRAEIQLVFNEYPELRQYVRQHPSWYRRLSREPSQLSALEKEANYFYGRTLPQRVEKVQSHLRFSDDDDRNA